MTCFAQIRLELHDALVEHGNPRLDAGAIGAFLTRQAGR